MARVGAVIAVLAAPLAVSTSASAGTLTGATWSVMDPRTNIQGNRYDYGFTTATAGTVSRVAAAVPAGTTGPNRYLTLGGSPNDFASTPDTAANSVTGDIDIRVNAALNSWGSGSEQTLVSKWNSGSANSSYLVSVLPAGYLQFAWINGSGAVKNYAPGIIPFGPGVKGWVRVTLTVSTGVLTTYTSLDGTSWTQIGTANAGATAINDGPEPVRIGVQSTGSAPAIGKVYYADIRNSISGTTTSPTSVTANVGNCFNPSDDAVAGTSWASSSATAETWSLTRNSTNVPVDIASDLSVMNVSGIAANGTAQLREIDGKVVYTLPTPTSVPAGTAVKLGLAGMTNTYTAGSPTSTITTLDSGGTGIDSATTNAVALTAPVINRYSAAPTVLQSATPATSVDVWPNGLGVSGTNVLYSDYYANTSNAIDSSGNATRFVGNGLNGSTLGGTALTTPMNQPSGVVKDSGGNTYVLDQGGYTVKKITSAGAISTLVAAGAGLIAAQDMTIDSSDNIYIANKNNHVVNKLTTSGALSVFAGTQGSAGSTLGSSATSSNLYAPSDVAVSADRSTLYIADSGNNRVLQVTVSNGAISIFAGGGGSFNDGGSPTGTSLSNPSGIAVTSAGDVYISDTGNNRIRKVSGGVINTVVGTGTAGFSGDGASATAATISSPRAVRVDSSGNIFFVDYVNQRIRKVSGTTITTFAGTGTSSWNGDGGDVSKAHFFQPGQMHADPNGNMFVSDVGNQVIRKIDKFGIVSTVAGTGPANAGFSGDGGPAISAKLNGPQDVIPDNAGNFYIADTGNSRIRKVDSNGNISTLTSSAQIFQLAFSTDYTTLYASMACTVYKVNLSNGALTGYAGNGSCTTPSGDGGPATSATMQNSRGLATDSTGALFISDYGPHQIRRVDASGTITTVSGNGGGYTDGGSNRTQGGSGLNRLASDSAGNIYEQSLARIMRLGNNGTALTIAGNGTNAYPGDGSAASLATFCNPSGFGFNLGNFLIADDCASTIRVVANQAATAPLVNADSVNVPMNGNRSWPILSNDWSRSNEMDPSSVVIKTQPTNGTVTINKPTSESSTLQASITATGGYTGNDSFTYQACDTTRVQCATATVSLTISNIVVTTAIGGVTEGYAANIGLNPSGLYQYKNYLFIADSRTGTIRRYDIYSKQIVTFAGMGYGRNSGTAATSNFLYSVGALTGGPDGTVFAAEPGSNRIRQIAPNGVMTIPVGSGTSGNSADGTTSATANITGPNYLAIGPTGTLFFSSGHTVRSAVIGGNIGTVAGTGTAGSTTGATAAASQVNNPKGVAVNAAGEVVFADTGNCAVRRVVGTTITTVAGTLGTCGNGTDGANATSTNINNPTNLAIDTTGAFLVTDNTNNRVQRFTVGGTINVIATSGSSYSSGVTATNFNLSNMTGFAVNPAGGYWVSAGGIALVAGFNNFTTSAVSNVVAGVSTSAVYSSSYSGENQLGYQTQLQLSGGWAAGSIAADSAGNIYVADAPNNRIRKLDVTTNLVTTYVGDGTTATLNAPGGQMTFGPAGQLAYMDSNCRVKERSTGGVITTVAGNGTCAYGGDGGPATSASINGFGGLAYNAAGDLFIAARAENRVRRVDNVSKVITTVVGNGTASTTGNGGLASAATIDGARNLTFDKAGNLFIMAGTPRMVDKAGYISNFVSYSRTAIDATGRLFYAEGGCNVVYKNVSGQASYVAASCQYGYNDDTNAGGAVFYGPDGVAVSGNDLYVYDNGNGKIRKIAGAASSTANTISASKWTVIPAATGHTNPRETFSFTPASTTTSSKLTVSVPTSFAGSSLSVVEAYGVTGTTTATLSGTTVTFAYPSQSLSAGVPVTFSIEGITNLGSVGAYSASFELYDGAGTTTTGVLQSNTVNQTASTGPSVNDVGFGSVFKRNLSATASALPAIAVSPIGVTDATSSFTLTNSGSINNNSTTFAAPVITGFTPITSDNSTSVASASFPVNRWGVQLTSSTGTLAGASGSGLFSGLSASATSVVSAGTAANVLTVTPRAKISYLQPAATYKSTLTWRFAGGS